MLGRFKWMAAALVMLVLPAQAQQQTMIPRGAAAPPGIPLTVETPALVSADVVAQIVLPVTAFPFTMLKAFGAVNVADQGLVRHYDPVAFGSVGVTTVGSPPAVVLGGLAAIGSVLVAADDGTGAGACGCIWWIDPVMHTVITSTALGGPVRDVVSDGSFIYASLDTVGAVKKIDPATKLVVATLSEPNVFRLAWDGGTHIWATEFVTDRAVEIDTNTMTVTRAIAVPPGPWGIDIDGFHVWIGGNGHAPGSGSIASIERSTSIVATYPQGGPNAIHYVKRWRNFLLAPAANANGVIWFDTIGRKVWKWFDACPNDIDALVDKENGNWWVSCGGGALVPPTPMIQVRKLETAW